MKHEFEPLGSREQETQTLEEQLFAITDRDPKILAKLAKFGDHPEIILE